MVTLEANEPIKDETFKEVPLGRETPEEIGHGYIHRTKPMPPVWTYPG